MKPIQEIYPQLTQPRKIAITTHQKPDADAMGASLALLHFLKQLGHTVTVVSPTNWAKWLDWMPGCKEVIDFDLNKEKANEVLNAAEWLFCLDFNIFHRTKTLTERLKELTCVKILIDHHQEPDEPSFNYGISNTNKSSTCEMVYDFIKESGHGDKINEDIAECIYAGVVADTGSFRFPSATHEVHTLVADLKLRGLKHAKVHENLFDNFFGKQASFYRSCVVAPYAGIL